MGRENGTHTGWAGRAARLSLQAALAAPLVYVPALAFEWTLPGAIGARGAVALAALCVAWLTLRGRLHPELHGEPVFWALVAALAVAAAAVPTGVSAGHSLFGNLERGGGLVAGIHLVLWYLLARSTLDGAGWRRALRVVAGVAAAAALVAVGHGLQLAAAGADELRAAAPLDNPGQLGVFMVLGATASAASAFDSEVGDRGRRLALAGAGLCLAGLLASGTRAALLGLAVGAAAGAATWAVRSSERGSLRKVGAAVVGLALLGAAMLGLRAADDAGGLPGPEQVVREISELDEDSTLQRRLVAWGAARKAVSERPLTGWGPENFRIAFDRHADPGRPYTLDRSISYDRAHNAFAEAAVAAGLPGLLAALGLAAALLWMVVRLARGAGAGTPAEAGALTAGIVAYGTFLMFWYQLPVVTLAFLALVGRAAHRTGEGRWLRPGEPAAGEGEGAGAGTKAAAAIAAALAAAVALHAVLLVPPARALQEARSTDDAAPKFRAFDRAVAARVPGAEETVTGYAAALGGLASRARRLARQPGAEAILDPAFRSARSALARQIEADPANARLRGLRGRLLLAESRFRGERALVERAAEALAGAVERAPAQLYYRYTLAEILRILEEHEGSVTVLEGALAAAPRIDETRVHLARAHLAAGRPGVATDRLLEGADAADTAADTVLMRRLLAELPADDERAAGVRDLLTRARGRVESEGGGGR